MLALFLPSARKARKVNPIPQAVPEEPRAVVRDRYTHTIIFSGSREDCEAYAEAFGLCYVEV